jgi:hypothetical protein
MILVPKMKKIATAVVSFALAACSLATTAFADQPYEGYNYDWWGDPVPSQTGYVVDRVITGLDFKTGVRYNSEAQLKEIAAEHNKQYFATQQEIDDYNKNQDLKILLHVDILNVEICLHEKILLSQFL